VLKIVDEQRAGSDWPPVVVASVFQTGLNLMRDLIHRGVTVIGIDCDSRNPGFHSVYGESHLCPDPDRSAVEWLEFMKTLAKRIGRRPLLIAASDQFVSAMGTHAAALKPYYIFSEEAVQVQAALATKEQQYPLAERHGFPIPRTAYIQSAQQLIEFSRDAQFPCLLKPRHQREWDSLPVGNPLRGRKLITGENLEELLGYYELARAYRPDVMAQEIIAGPDDAKYCYLSVYARDGSRLGYCVVREHRCNPVMFGSASLVEPIIDREIADVCDCFLRAIQYVGLCEIEVKRDARDGKVKLIEVNPRFSGTGDCARYMGVEVGWLHYLDMIGKRPEPMEAGEFDFLHVTLLREVAAVPVYLRKGLLTFEGLLRSYRRPMKFYDFDARDWRVTTRTLWECGKILGVEILRTLRLKAARPS